ncbi:hypothetical protein [uncultured Methanobrevibacter sp.]|uniref:hypothetical protein n=1 Tax=uncultured Methanobrevibacter sp. TaxID=253161 RepID=UPI0025F366FA|nr:hypothetical protein [uncultured Methanobrevibacter sp.]
MKSKICPRCGSHNVEWIIPQVWSRWVCYNCDYTGPIIEADSNLEEEIIKNWKLNKDEIMAQAEEDRKKILDGTFCDDEKDVEVLSEEELEKKLKELGI